MCATHRTRRSTSCLIFCDVLESKRFSRSKHSRAQVKGDFVGSLEVGQTAENSIAFRAFESRLWATTPS